MRLALAWNEPLYWLEGASSSMRSAGELELRRLEMQRSLIVPDLINTPAWAILIHLVAQGSDTGVLPLRAIATKLHMLERLAGRWVRAMEEEDLVHVQNTHFGDYVGLTDKARAAMCEYFKETDCHRPQVAMKVGAAKARPKVSDVAVGSSLAVFMSAVFIWPLISLLVR